MGVLLTLIAGLVVWVVLWALGTGDHQHQRGDHERVEPAGAVHIVAPHLPGRRREG